MRGKKLGASEEIALLKTDKKFRREVFKDLLRHIRAGYSAECFATVPFSMIQSLLTEYPEEWCETELEKATRDAKAGWEAIGRKQAEGTCLGNSRSWYYNMSNRYGWSERQDIKSEQSGSVQVNVVSYTAQANTSSNAT